MAQVTAILQEVFELDLKDRAELVSSLLEELDPLPHYLTDEEARHRVEELRAGARFRGLQAMNFGKPVVGSR